MDSELLMLQRLEDSLKRAASVTKEQISLNGFDIFISPSENAYMNFAVPKLGITAWASAIAEMVQLFRDKQRQPRLEYFHELHPTLKDALAKEGLVQDMSTPVMTLIAVDLSQAKPVPDTEYMVLNDDQDKLETFLRRQSLAFGGLGDDSALSWLDSMMQGLRQGSVQGAVLTQHHEMVSGAIIQGQQDGELAGVWTLPSVQRQGLSYALCQRLLADYFATGQTLCWLSAAEGALKLYETLGFKRVGTQLNWSLPFGAATQL
jgi:ribosomal protein S18 acetylase RimI-like enzyme